MSPVSPVVQQTIQPSAAAPMQSRTCALAQAISLEPPCATGRVVRVGVVYGYTSKLISILPIIHIQHLPKEHLVVSCRFYHPSAQVMIDKPSCITKYNPSTNGGSRYLWLKTWANPEQTRHHPWTTRSQGTKRPNSDRRSAQPTANSVASPTIWPTIDNALELEVESVEGWWRCV